jgi:hypothetical protein
LLSQKQFTSFDVYASPGKLQTQQAGDPQSSQPNVFFRQDSFFKMAGIPDEKPASRISGQPASAIWQK